MKRSWIDRIALIVLGCALAWGVAMNAREARDRRFDRRIYFAQREGIYYILAREYRRHWIVGDTLILSTSRGLIELDLDRAKLMETLKKIEELKADGIIKERQ